MTALTRELLERRLGKLADDAEEVAGPPEGILLARLLCDRCGREVNLLVQQFPTGWTTSGDLEGGFTDLCAACSS